MSDELKFTVQRPPAYGGDFKKNYGKLIGAYLYLRSISAARGRSPVWTGLIWTAIVRDLHRTWLRMQGDIRGKLHANEAIPESIFAEVVVISRHEMPLNALERAHVFNRPRQGLLGHLLFFVDVAGN